MTDPLERIRATKETSKRTAPDMLLKHGKHAHLRDDIEEDSVDISEEARERAAGKKRRNILDYLNEEPV